MSDAEALAQRFHETYERLAPSFGYETREASAKPWAQVPEQNRALMTAVCAEMLADASYQADVARLTAELDRLRGLVGDEDYDRERWANCSRAEAIRQANEFHAAQLRWLDEHDKRRDERDDARAELDQLRPVVKAAKAWRNAGLSLLESANRGLTDAVDALDAGAATGGEDGDG
jgi:hypothetical protein